MATQQDLIAQAQAQLAQLQTIATEIGTLETLVTTLQAQIAAGSNPDPALVTAMQAVSDQLGVVQTALNPPPPAAPAAKA